MILSNKNSFVCINNVIITKDKNNLQYEVTIPSAGYKSNGT